jgi:hypothetical protein
LNHQLLWDLKAIESMGLKVAKYLLFVDVWTGLFEEAIKKFPESGMYT